MELSKQEMELFLPFPFVGSKTSLTKASPIDPMFLNWFSETGNGII
jgi:hypothetical protein